MKEQYYQFEFILSGNSEPSDEIEDALYEAGCDDASILYRNGTMYLMFARKASNELEAIASAVRDVHAADERLKVMAVLVDYEDEVSTPKAKKNAESGRYMIKVDVADDKRIFVTKTDVKKDVSAQDMLNSLTFTQAQRKAILANPAIEDQLVNTVTYLYKTKALKKQDSFLMYLDHAAA